MKKDIRNPAFFEGHLEEMMCNGAPAALGGSRCLYSHHATRCSISKKMWLNDQNDIFYFVTEAHCKWEFCLSLLVKASELQSDHWFEGKQAKFLKKELKFSYPQKANSVTGKFQASACRICRLPFENFSSLPDKKDKLYPVAIFAEGPQVSESVYALLGRLSVLEGSGRDVKQLVEEAQQASGVRVLYGQPFVLQYCYSGAVSDDAEEEPVERREPTGKRARDAPNPAGKRPRRQPKRQAEYSLGTGVLHNRFKGNHFMTQTSPRVSSPSSDSSGCISGVSERFCPDSATSPCPVQSQLVNPAARAMPTSDPLDLSTCLSDAAACVHGAALDDEAAMAEFLSSLEDDAAMVNPAASYHAACVPAEHMFQPLHSYASEPTPLVHMNADWQHHRHQQQQPYPQQGLMSTRSTFHYGNRVQMHTVTSGQPGRF